MNYFILSQDERITNAVKPVGIAQVIKKEVLTIERMEELEELERQFPVLEKGEVVYIDLIEKPIMLISDAVKQLVEKYVPNMPFKAVVLTDMPKLMQTLYWLVIPPRVRCLSAQTEFHLDGTLKKLVIDEQLAAPYSFFQIEGIKEQFIVVNIELAESILRRDFRGIRLQKIQTEGRWNDILSVGK
ncbi:serine protease [Lysinibacillus sp. JK80]|uniref:serine protease n=1 Tax=Lysinibacillus sp. JK80 TaxID=2749809 RepID=UPI0022B9477F|nr:serine protease [Lysinibacillus sp. JK80]WBF54501.1 serine protease [Lysinibacillus sp. JK80]